MVFGLETQTVTFTNIDSQEFWNNIQMKPGHNRQHHVQRNLIDQHKHLKCTVVEGWRFGLNLRPQDQDTLQSWNQPHTFLYTNVY